jgi:AcrR family transcriptional regulator
MTSITTARPAIDRPALDRRTQRTRDALRDAMMVLLHERGWDEIAVQDVCTRANVGRSTFYLHYPSKDALLVGGLNDLRLGLQSQLRAQAHNTPFRFAHGLIAHAQEQHQVFRGLIGRRSGYVVQQRFREMVLLLVTDDMPASADPVRSQAIARTLAGAFVELLSWWVEQGMPLAPAQLELLFQGMAQPALQELTAG